jgi:hypothetical protein
LIDQSRHSPPGQAFAFAFGGFAPNLAVQPMVAAPLKLTLRRRARSAAVRGKPPFSLWGPSTPLRSSPSFRDAIGRSTDRRESRRAARAAQGGAYLFLRKPYEGDERHIG